MDYLYYSTRQRLKGHYLYCCVCRLAPPMEPYAAGIETTDPTLPPPPPSPRPQEALANTKYGNQILVLVE
jgi:hypothetical protein